MCIRDSPTFLHLRGLKGVSAKLYLHQTVDMCAPVYCVMFFWFARVAGYEQAYYPIIRGLSQDQWHRAVFFYCGIVFIEAFVFIAVSVYYNCQDTLEFSPYVHGYKQLRQIGSTVVTIPMCSYLMLTLALWQHQFEPVASGSG
eukprot:TRINITY_DN14090_c0_g1_i2.p1 TRINITY_DN14090_c0_g1~~TRINITY_DN14090_c0_g1_i2.p1  ORF type:complete len:143 (-),score=23.06 TRINITY_DN14090_c0_g1_i2:217-645(-)